MQKTPTSLTIVNHLNDDLRFLIACCQSELLVDDIEFIDSYLNSEGLKLNTLIRLANQHNKITILLLLK